MTAHQPNAGGNAVLTSPSNNSSLTSSSVTFNWNNVGADQYGIRVGTGTTVEMDNIYFDGVTTGTSLVVNNLPEDGSALYVKLFTNYGSTWTFEQYTLTAHQTNSNSSPPSWSEGFDWSLPAYADALQSVNGGIIKGREQDPDSSEINGAFLEVLWYHSELENGVYNFDYFDARLARVDKAIVRLEVNSQCHTPSWTTIPFLSSQSLQFWKQEYINQISGFITAFADQYKADPKIIGVQLGIADGKYETNSCPNLLVNMNDPGSALLNPEPFDGTENAEIFDRLVYGFGRQGWGEFWMNDDELSKSIDNGLSAGLFESSVQDIIDVYVSAFGAYKYKLAFTNFDLFNSNSSYQDKMPSIANYAIDSGIGNRGGQIEIWMRYTDKLYGVDLISKNGSDECYMTFDEVFADKIQGRYWGEENEEYGINWTKDFGPLENQTYRFYMSSLRALQLRRNYFSTADNDIINNIMNTNDEYNSAEFMTYLSKTLGRTRTDTPDAFVVLGERTIDTNQGLFPTEYDVSNSSNQSCLNGAGNRGYVKVREFGRWLSEVGTSNSGETVYPGNNSPMKVNMPDFIHIDNDGVETTVEKWGQFMSEFSFEYQSRKSDEFIFDINNQLIQERCSNVCDLEVKVVFHDDHVMNLQVNHTTGVSGVLTTKGDGQIKTATFPVSGAFTNGYNGADFGVKTTDGSGLSVLMTRINIVSEQNSPGNTLLDENNLSASEGESLQFSFELPAGVSELNIAMTNVTGDPDLYVQHGSPPTQSNYTCRPFEGLDEEEICNLSNPQAGTWYIMLLADNNFSGVNLSASIGNNGFSTLLDESNLSTSEGESLQFSFELPAGVSELNIAMTNVTGDPDLYVQHGSPPTQSNYTCRPFEGLDEEEICNLSNPQAGTWYIMLLADNDFSGVNLNAISQ